MLQGMALEMVMTVLHRHKQTLLLLLSPLLPLLLIFSAPSRWQTLDPKGHWVPGPPEATGGWVIRVGKRQPSFGAPVFCAPPPRFRPRPLCAAFFCFSRSRIEAEQRAFSTNLHTQKLPWKSGGSPFPRPLGGAAQLHGWIASLATLSPFQSGSAARSLNSPKQVPLSVWPF